ncbi:MAG: hypothetical protein HW382_890 [Deltaproteobacteria bacterium]|nr:hypothetical protein [Deltaproteobacteria bacterium]
MSVRQARETYKEIISSEIQNLSESEMEKIVKMIHFLKVEFLSKREKVSEEAFKRARGAWRDVNIEEINKKLDEAWKNWNPALSV